MKVRVFHSLFSLSCILLICISSKTSYSKDVDDSELKRLFYSQLERQNIDKARDKSTSTSAKTEKQTIELKSKESVVETASKNAKKETIVIDGYIQRGDGKNVVWFNNTSTLNEDNVDKNLSIKSQIINDKGIDIVSKKRRLHLKPGQVLDISTGEVSESYRLKDSAAKMEVENQ